MKKINISLISLICASFLGQIPAIAAPAHVHERPAREFSCDINCKAKAKADLAKQIDLVKPAFDGGFTSELTLAYENIARDYMLLGDLNGCIDFTFNESNKVDASKLTKAQKARLAEILFDWHGRAWELKGNYYNAFRAYAFSAKQAEYIYGIAYSLEQLLDLQKDADNALAKAVKNARETEKTANPQHWATYQKALADFNNGNYESAKSLTQSIFDAKDYYDEYVDLYANANFKLGKIDDGIYNRLYLVENSPLIGGHLYTSAYAQSVFDNQTIDKWYIESKKVNVFSHLLTCHSVKPWENECIDAYYKNFIPWLDSLGIKPQKPYQKALNDFANKRYESAFNNISDAIKIMDGIPNFHLLRAQIAIAALVEKGKLLGTIKDIEKDLNRESSVLLTSKEVHQAYSELYYYVAIKNMNNNAEMFNGLDRVLWKELAYGETVLYLLQDPNDTKMRARYEELYPLFEDYRSLSKERLAQIHQSIVDTNEKAIAKIKAERISIYGPNVYDSLELICSKDTPQLRAQIAPEICAGVK